MKKIYLLVMIVIFFSFANANMLRVEIEPRNNTLISYFQFDDITPYITSTGETEYLSNVIIEGEYINGKKVNSTPTFGGVSIFENAESLVSFSVIKETKLLYKKEVSYCNNNNICEPCLGNCDVSENVLVCKDCTKEKDGLCQPFEEGVCDLDCSVLDKDCRADDFTICSSIGKSLCNESEICLGETTILGDKSCCLGECVVNDINLETISCSSLSLSTCSKSQICTGNELSLEHTQEICCSGVCEEKIQQIENPFLEDEKNYSVFYIVLAIFVLLLLIGIIKKHHSFVLVSLTGIAIILIILISTFTGNVVLESPQEQAQMICEISKSYNLPSSYLLAIAYKESGINHYRGNSVLITNDGGVGIMQIDRGDKNDIPSGPFYACGVSLIDGRKLDAKIVKDNIECGAIELLQKCTSLACIGNQKEYYCPNSDNPLPEKRVIYKDWDIAIRAYNGWGCISNYYKNSMGANSPQYIDLISRIQSYVEDFRYVEQQLQGYCGETTLPTTPPTNPEPKPSSGIDRNKIVDYAKAYATKVVGDGCFFTNGDSPTCNTGSIKAGAAAPNNFATGSDCAHFASYVLGQAGIGIVCRYAPSTCIPYGEPGAQNLRDYILTNGIGKKANSIGDLEPGDLIFYDWSSNGKGKIDHVAVYIGNNQVASHTSNGIFNWQMGDSAASFTFMHLLNLGGSPGNNGNIGPSDDGNTNLAPTPIDDAMDKIKTGEIYGYYYINPSYRIESEISFIPTLIEKTNLWKTQTGNSYFESVTKVLLDSGKNNWHIGGCPDEEIILEENSTTFRFCVEEGKKTLKFALTMDGVMEESAEKPIVTQSTTPNVIPPTQTFPPAGQNDCSVVIEGVDVSHHNDVVDWKNLKNNKRDFAFIKATEGDNFLDNRFKINMEGAKNSGILAGPYHFARPDLNNAEDEAYYFASIIRPYLSDGNLLPALDLETKGNLDSAALTKWVDTFMSTFEKQTGIRPILYTNPDFLINKLDISIRTKYYLWVAAYSTKSPSDAYNVRWDIWQYTDSGSKFDPNLPDKLDLDMYCGSFESFKQKFTIGGLKTPVTQPVDDDFEELFSGIRYKKFIADSPRPVVYYVVKVDLTNPNLNMEVTPGNQLGQRTSDFLRNSGTKLAINGDEHTGIHSPKGYAMSNGVAYSQSTTGEQAVFISKNNKVSIGAKPPEGTWNAVSGSHVILENGALAARIGTCSKPEYCNDLQPRTSIGVNKDSTLMILVIVDGRRPGFSEGVTLPELAGIHLSHGSYNAINLDGGGSTTLVAQGLGILNHPTDPPANANPSTLNNYGVSNDINAYTERTVANHLGIHVS